MKLPFLFLHSCRKMPGLVCCSSQRLNVPPAVPGFSTLLGTALLFSQWNSLSKGDDFCIQPVVTVLLETCPGNSCRNIEVELKPKILYCWSYTIALVAPSQPGHASCSAVWCMPAEILHWNQIVGHHYLPLLHCKHWICASLCWDAWDVSPAMQHIGNLSGNIHFMWL